MNHKSNEEIEFYYIKGVDECVGTDDDIVENNVNSVAKFKVNQNHHVHNVNAITTIDKCDHEPVIEITIQVPTHLEVTHKGHDRSRNSSVGSNNSIKSGLTSDRRSSRRISVFSRQTESPSNNLTVPEDNPLRRKLSFIKDTAPDEPLTRASIQILVASILAGFGNVGAGVVINIIQDWKVFIDIRAMFVLIPSLLGLKGNLEMTMASRLSTEANMGRLNSWPRTFRIVGGDMVMVQLQATIVSFLAAFVALLIDLAETKSFDLNKALVLISSSVVTANVACLLLGFLMVFVIVFSNKVNIDPDNIATPIAASVGDISTAGLFALFSKWIYADNIDRGSPVPVLAVTSIVIFVILLPLLYVICRKNAFTRNLVHTGWGPVIIAMTISSGGGFFLDKAVQGFDKLPPFNPVICGVGGNLVAVACSKISTHLHMNAKLGTLPKGISRFSSPIAVFYNKQDINAKLCLILFSMALPLHLLYSMVIWGIQKDIHMTFLLASFYIGFALIQVFLLLFIGYNLVHILWSFAINPDMSAIPIMTSLGDFFGSSLLFTAFTLLQDLNDENALEAIVYATTPSSNSTINSTLISNPTLSYYY